MNSLMLGIDRHCRLQGICSSAMRWNISGTRYGAMATPSILNAASIGEHLSGENILHKISFSVKILLDLQHLYPLHNDGHQQE